MLILLLCVGALNLFLQKICHFDDGDGRIKSLVPGFCAGPLHRLLDILACNDAERDRFSALEDTWAIPFATSDAT